MPSYRASVYLIASGILAAYLERGGLYSSY
jgi:hypothetical protein